MRVTSTEHVPFRMPFTRVPTNVQYRDPRTMVKRIEPCDVLGIVSNTCAAIARAVMNLFRLTRSTRAVTEVGCWAACVVVVGATVVLVDDDVVDDDVVDDELVDDELVDDDVVDDELVDDDVVVVVVGDTVSDDTVTAARRRVCVESPNWPNPFSPQHFTAPASVTAHACAAPTATSTTFADRPLTPAGV